MSLSIGDLVKRRDGLRSSTVSNFRGGIVDFRDGGFSSLGVAFRLAKIDSSNEWINTSYMLKLPNVAHKVKPKSDVFRLCTCRFCLKLKKVRR